jgi:hypothetical protein
VLAEKLLAKKQSDTAEIEIHLFENCNIACGYCSQDHYDAGPSKESFDRKKKLANTYMPRLSSKSEHCRISIMGGELFQDKFGSDVWVLYKELIADLYMEAKKWFSGRVSVGASTNFLFSNDKPLEVLINNLQSDYDIDFRLKTSYDMKGRPFTQRLITNFVRNLSIFRKNTDSISVCLHKPNIHAMVKGEDSILKSISQGLELCFDWYIPDGKNDSKYFPSDEECKQVLLHLMKEYPDSTPVREMLKGEIGHVQCCSENRVLIPSNEIVSNCVYLPNEYKNPINRDTTYDKATTFMVEQGCTECPQFMSCSLYCYAASDYAKRIQNAKCFIREAYEQSISEGDPTQ